MANTYKRKRITSLDDLDREQARLRKKTNNIEHEWTDLLDPQQLVVTFLSNYFGKKLRNKISPQKESSIKKKTQGTPLTSSEIKKKKKNSFLKNIFKTIFLSAGILILVKKLMQTNRNKNNAKS